MTSSPELSRAARALLWILMVGSAVGVCIWWFHDLSEVPVSEWRHTTISSFSYFTQLTNTLVVVMSASLLFGKGKLRAFFAQPTVQAAVAMYIFFVGFAFWTILGGPQDIEKWFLWIPQVTAHTLSPLLGPLFWWVAAKKGEVRFKHMLLWLIYPLTYSGYWMLRGPIVGEYPYFFLDVNELGYGGVAIWIGILMALFLFFGAILMIADRIGARRATPA